MSAWRAQKAEKSRRRFASFRNICSKADNSLMKLQGDIWDSMVQYGEQREKQGFIAGLYDGNVVYSEQEVQEHGRFNSTS